MLRSSKLISIGLFATFLSKVLPAPSNPGVDVVGSTILNRAVRDTGDGGTNAAPAPAPAAPPQQNTQQIKQEPEDPDKVKLLIASKALEISRKLSKYIKEYEFESAIVDKWEAILHDKSSGIPEFEALIKEIEANIASQTVSTTTAPTKLATDVPLKTESKVKAEPAASVSPKLETENKVEPIQNPETPISQQSEKIKVHAGKTENVIVDCFNTEKALEGERISKRLKEYGHPCVDDWLTLSRGRCEWPLPTAKLIDLSMDLYRCIVETPEAKSVQDIPNNLVTFFADLLFDVKYVCCFHNHSETVIFTYYFTRLKTLIGDVFFPQENSNSWLDQAKSAITDFAGESLTLQIIFAHLSPFPVFGSIFKTYRLFFYYIAGMVIFLMAFWKKGKDVAPHFAGLLIIATVEWVMMIDSLRNFLKTSYDFDIRVAIFLMRLFFLIRCFVPAEKLSNAKTQFSEFAYGIFEFYSNSISTTFSTVKNVFVKAEDDKCKKGKGKKAEPAKSKTEQSNSEAQKSEAQPEATKEDDSTTHNTRSKKPGRPPGTLNESTIFKKILKGG